MKYKNFSKIQLILIHTLVLLHLFLINTTVWAKKPVIVTTYQYIAGITEQITGNSATVIALAPPQFDPHYIVPKPSYIAKLRNANLLIINGAQLEIGWLPQLIRQANNPAIITGTKGFLDLSNFVKKIDVPTALSRAMGDVHPEGNPHFYLDPHTIPVLAKAIYERLCTIVPENYNLYSKNYTTFIEKFNAKLTVWDAQMTKVKGKSAIEYHKIYDYLLIRYGIHLAGTIEPVPGIPPASKHIAKLENTIYTVSFILQDVYHPYDAAQYLSQKFSIPVIVLPHDVGATSDANDIFSLFDAIVGRITQ